MMAKKAKPSGNAAKTLSREVLVQHATGLVAVLRSLRKQDANVTSDALWKIIQQSWSEKDLLIALRHFEASKKLDRFKKIIQPLPQAGPDGFFKADGEEWGSILALSRKLKLSETPIRIRLRGFRSHLGMDRGNQITTFYALADVRKACAHLFTHVPRADKSGCFEVDGEKWGTVRAIAKELQLTSPTISKRLDAVRTREGRDRGNRSATFYALADVKKSCVHLLTHVPIADKSGFFEIDGEKWGPARTIARMLQLGQRAVEARIDSCRACEGKDSTGRLTTFYSLSDMKKACSDLLGNFPKANKDGLFIADGEWWGTKEALARRLNVSTSPIISRLGSCRSRKGRDQTGRSANFFALSDIKKKLSV